MNLRSPLAGGRWMSVLVAAALLMTALALGSPAPAHAQCGPLPGQPTCEPPPEKPTKTPRPRPTRTPTATATETASITPTPTETAVPCDTHVLTATLSGLNEVPGVASGGIGSVKLLLDLNAGTITGNWQTAMIGSITAAHIHDGPAGKNAGVFIPFSGLPIGGSFATQDSAPAPKLQDVLNNPPAFYVNVHTQAYPGGEIRGQLACAPAEPVASPTATATTSPLGGPTGGGGSSAMGLELGLIGIGGLALGLGLFSLRRPSFPAGMRIGLILLGALCLIGALLLGLLSRTTALPGNEKPAATATFDYSTVQ